MPPWTEAGEAERLLQIFFACAKIGAIVTLLNFAYTSAELKHALSSTKAKLLITTIRSGKYDYFSILKSLEHNLTSLKKVVLLPNISSYDVTPPPSSYFCNYSDLIDQGSRTPRDWRAIESEISYPDILNLQFTSGSTGAPKAAALTHSGLINSATYIGQNLGIESRDKIVIPVPLFHAFGLIMGKGSNSLSRSRLLTRCRTVYNICGWCHRSSTFRVLRCWTSTTSS
jgi:mevalonyl-CoA ligase